jgi:hypothetical protein
VEGVQRLRDGREVEVVGWDESLKQESARR